MNLSAAHEKAALRCRKSFEGVAAEVGEFQAGPDQQVADDPRHQDLVGSRLFSDPGCGVHGDPGNVAIGTDFDHSHVRAESQ